MPNLIWTRERPTVPGNYWWRQHGFPTVVMVLYGPNDQLVAKAGFWVERKMVDSMPGEWAGPLPHPEEPRG